MFSFLEWRNFQLKNDFQDTCSILFNIKEIFISILSTSAFIAKANNCMTMTNCEIHATALPLGLSGRLFRIMVAKIFSYISVSSSIFVIYRKFHLSFFTVLSFFHTFLWLLSHF